MQNNYVCYHLHTSLSLLDSCTSYKDYVLRAKELGQKAICFTEHGNIFNWIEKKMYCESTQYKVFYNNGEYKYFDDKKKLDKFAESHEIDKIQELAPIKYIHGIEIYLTANDIGEEKVRDNYHTILIAADEIGFRELNSLIDLSTQEDHFYFKPRVTFSEFLNISEHIIKISACLASPLKKYQGDKLEDLLQHYDYYEIQPHIYSEAQKEYNRQLVKWAKQYNKPLIAGTDTHSINKYKAECRSILQKAKHIEYQDEDKFDLTYKTCNELIDMFDRQGVLEYEVYLQAIENTNIMADSVFEFQLDTSFKYPKLYDDEEAVFKKLINDMYHDKIKKGIIQPAPRYKENVREEMRVFKKIGMVGFMLFMSELVRWCWNNNIPVGYCRGSVGGSTIAYLTDIIDVNPIIWNTVFSRFANEDRKEIGDIDIDISPSQRGLVYDHIIQTFGLDKTAYVLAIGTISDKGTIDDIARALAEIWRDNHAEYQKMVEEIKNKIKNTKDLYGKWEIETFEFRKLSEYDSTYNPYSLENVKQIKKEYEENPQKARCDYPELFYYFDGLVDTPVSQSMHPAGIIVSPVTLPDNYGTFWNEGKRILTINMEEIHEVSLVKYDILGLKNIEIIKDTCELAHISYPKSHEINWEDKNVWEHIIDSPVGIFQFEGAYAFDLLKKFRPQKINDMSLVNASLRPSGESYRDKLIAHEANHNPSELIDQLLAPNHGWLVYQEDVIAFLQKICGLTGSEADNVRRAIGRKQMDRLQEALPDILEGYCSKSDKPREIAEEEARAFLKIIEDSSSYMFGYNHSNGYSMIGYTCGYLRHYYPVEFITAYLNNANNDDDINAGTVLAQQLKIDIQPIKFRHSEALYSCEAKNKIIYKGLASIKHISDGVANELLQFKDKKYQDFIELLIDIKNTPVNSKQLDIIIKLNFFSEFGPINSLLTQVDLFNKIYGKKILKPNKCEEMGIPLWIAQKHAKKQTEKQLKDFDSLELLRDVIAHTTFQKTSIIDRLKYENEFLGYLTSTIPKAKEDYYYVQNITGYSNNIYTLYQLKTGQNMSIKLRTRNPDKPQVGNIIKVLEITKDKKWSKDENGEWYRKDEYENLLTKYSFVR